jgi:hypothetical protein
LEEALRLALKNFPHLALLPKRFEPLKKKRKKKDKKKKTLMKMSTIILI